jgi:hypothetical protein
MMVKKHIVLLILGGLFLFACEESVEIQNQPFESKPVIYCMVDPNDTTHSIRIERMFSGIQAPAKSAGVPDSLLFKEVKVTVFFTPQSGSGTSSIQAHCVEVADKNPGYFGFQKHYLYQFEQVMKLEGRNIYNRIEIKVEIPGLPPVSAFCKIIESPVIWSPNSAQQYIYIVPDSPLRIQWSGGFWNEVDIKFEIKEMYADSISTKVLQFQKVNDVQINGKYYEVRIPYDLVIQGILKNFSYRENIIRRYFGPVTFSIHTGQEEYAKYIEYQNGINDFNQNPFSNIENGLGLLSSKSTIKKGPMVLDETCRLEFANDPVLKNLNFVEY